VVATLCVALASRNEAATWKKIEKVAKCY
jgi:hypothetical protein